jgi:hypothetical protein
MADTWKRRNGITDIAVDVIVNGLTLIQTAKVDEDINAYAKGIFGCLGTLIKNIGGHADGTTRYGK